MTNAASPTPRSEPQEEMSAAARIMFDHALHQCSIPQAFSRELQYANGVFTVSGKAHALSVDSDVVVVSIGKAGHTMAQSLAQTIPFKITGIVSCPTAPENPVPGLLYFIGGHPMPNQDSLRAGKAILETLHGLAQTTLVLFCISGGASAIVEWPLDPSLTLSDIVATNRALILSGAPIAEINAVRKHLSAIKGGRMARAAFPALQVSLLVSDVPDNALDALASGPTMPDSSTVADCYSVIERYDIARQLSPRVHKIFKCRELVETPKRGDPAFAGSQFVTLLSNRSAVDAAAKLATTLGFDVTTDNSCDDWDYARAADYLLKRIRDLRQAGRRACLISGGEVTVKVTNESGIGGRNQLFALYCATKIPSEPITVLSAGTDGIDGTSPAAGALADGTTIARSAAIGHDAIPALAGFDPYPLFESIGDAIVTGPTGNNVRDLRILLAS